MEGAKLDLRTVYMMVRETASQQQLNMWIPVQSATDDDGYNYYNRAVNQEKEKVIKVETGAMHIHTLSLSC